MDGAAMHHVIGTKGAEFQRPYCQHNIIRAIAQHFQIVLSYLGSKHIFV